MMQHLEKERGWHCDNVRAQEIHRVADLKTSCNSFIENSFSKDLCVSKTLGSQSERKWPVMSVITEAGFSAVMFLYFAMDW